jgi:hypothetical protein
VTTLKQCGASIPNWQSFCLGVGFTDIGLIFGPEEALSLASSLRAKRRNPWRTRIRPGLLRRCAPRNDEGWALEAGGLQAPLATLRACPMSSTGKIITTPKPTRARGAVRVVPV